MELLKEIYEREMRQKDGQVRQLQKEMAEKDAHLQLLKEESERQMRQKSGQVEKELILKAANQQKLIEENEKLQWQDM